MNRGRRQSEMNRGPRTGSDAKARTGSDLRSGASTDSLVRRFFRALLPPPREPVTAKSIWPLLIFLILFGGGCVVAEMSDWVLFTRLWPFFLLALSPWLWWMFLAGYSGLTKRRGVMSLLMRLALLALFIVVLAEPRSVRKDDRLSVVFVVDVSASVREDSWRDAMEYVLELVRTKPDHDLAGLVFFGRNAAVEHPPAMTLPYENINVQIDAEGTDISKSLRLAAAMLPEDKNGRIVLISDGVHTEGDLLGTLDELKAKGVPVDTRPITYNYDEEVWLERLEMPRFVKVGDTYQASVILSSLEDGAGTLTLTENGQVIRTQPVDYKAGKNRFDVSISLRKPGYYEYEATITDMNEKDATGQIVKYHDFKKENNRAVSHIYLQGQGKVLVVVDEFGEQRDYQRFVEALEAAERQVDVQSTFQFARNALALLPYDCVVFVNVPASSLDAQQMDAVHEAVYAQGTGFLMIGGANAYGPGGYARTPIEKVLPVSMDLSQKKVLPKGALVIVLHTCEFPQGNSWGKSITKQAIKVLNDRDDVGVLVYDWNGGDKWLFPLTPAGEYEKLAKQINKAQIGDMPSFAPSMQLAANALQASDASVKHMIVISDGDPSPPSQQLLKQFQKLKVRISTVTVFPHQGVGGPEVKLMASIAKLTGGNHWVPQNARQLPSIFIKEATTLRRSAIQNVTFVPEVTFPSDILKDIHKLPELHGYVLTTPKLQAKPKAKVILDGPEKEEMDPILAHWNYGLGRAAAWTSDLSPNWAKDWVSWNQYDAFVKQLMENVSRISGDGSLRMRSFPAGGEGVVIVEDYARDRPFINLQALVDQPDGTEKAMDLKQVGPGRYEARFPLTGQGQYRIAAFAAGTGRDDAGDAKKIERVHGGFVVPYSQEYLRFRNNPLTLQQVTQRSGGAALTGVETGEEVYTRDRREKQTSSPVFDIVLLVLAILIPLDVGLRRVQFDWSTVRGWLSLGRAEQPSKETFTALLQRKENVAGQMSTQDESAGSGGGRGHKQAKQAPQSTTLDLDELRASNAARGPVPSRGDRNAQADQAQEKPMSMTERLLAAKKRTRDEKDDSQ